MSEKEFVIKALDKAQLIAHLALEKKCEDLIICDLKELTSLAEYFVICSGSSTRSVFAVAEFIRREMKTRKIKLFHAEGIQESLWAILDFGDVIVHVFYPVTRAFYDLDHLWGDAPRIPVDSTITIKESF